MTTYMVKTRSKMDDLLEPQAGRKHTEEVDEDDIMVEVDVKKKPRTRAKIPAKGTVDQEVVALFKSLPVPLELVVRHGAAFESQAKRAIKQVYDEGKNYRKRKNPALASSKLSHPLTVSGVVGGFECERHRPRKQRVHNGCQHRAKGTYPPDKGIPAYFPTRGRLNGITYRRDGQKAAREHQRRRGKAKDASPRLARDLRCVVGERLATRGRRTRNL